MKISKATTKSTLFFVLAMAGANAQAASNARTVITGDIVRATCELDATARIDLGNWASSSFPNPGPGVETVAQDLVLGLTSCSGTLGENVNVYARVSGDTLTGHPTVFGKSGVTNTVGVQLEDVEGVEIKNGGTVKIATVPKTGGERNDDSGIAGESIVLKAKLYSTVANPGEQHIEAPINFNLTYQ